LFLQRALHPYYFCAQECLSFRDFCKDIKSIPTTPHFKKTVSELKTEKIDPQLRRLDREFDNIKKYRTKRGIAIGLGTLAGAAFQPLMIPAVMGGIAALMKEYADYDKEKTQLKENPLYFLWKIKSN
jgi:hypothetical protein